MRLKPIFRKIYFRRIKYVIPSIARIEIDAYFNYTFQSHYKELEISGMLEKFLDDSEIIYNDSLQLLKDSSPNFGTYIDEEKKAVNDSKQALSIVFQDISNKLTIQTV